MIDTPSMQQLLEAGVHFGHQVRRGHPHMLQFIYGVRDGVHIIDLEQSEKRLKEAVRAAYELGEEGKTLLLVGTKKQAQPIIKQAAQKVKMPYIDVKWLGGFLTNFEEVRKNIKKLNELKEKQAKGELNRYTKREQLLLSRKVEKFNKQLGGVTDLDQLPDALYIIDCVNEKIAVAEANRMHIPIIAIADTNSNPSLIDYPIPGNDDAAKSIKVLTEAIIDAFAEGLKKADKVKSDNAEKKEANKKDEVTESQDLVADVQAAEEEVEKEEVKDSERVE
ncbi:30S ribosomal protein S2 [Patescibacteria group bacterium]|nr:30S ribosomal protein S2 [Patescibacteria group bacterium]MCL5409482.1 30S ribosomal protein S2 [Patescibacteria group bacterium]